MQQQGGGGRDDGDSDDGPQTGTCGYKPPQPEPWVRPPQSFGDPPEPWKDRPHVFDVFSFGVMLWELAARRSVQVRTMRSELSGPPPSHT